MQKPTSLQVKAYEHLKNMILNRELVEDTIYSETQIAKSIGISRTPMRDAIQYLTQEKYIDIIPNKGFCLHKMNQQDFTETCQVRSAIEGFCAMQLAKDFNTERAKETFVKLRKTLEAQALAIPDKLDIYFENDIKFHEILVEYIQNAELSRLFNNYMYRMQNFALQSLQEEGRMSKALKEHLDVLESMEKGDDAKAHASMVYHMKKAEFILKDDENK